MEIRGGRKGRKGRKGRRAGKKGRQGTQERQGMQRTQGTQGMQGMQEEPAGLGEKGCTCLVRVSLCWFGLSRLRVSVPHYLCTQRDQLTEPV